MSVFTEMIISRRGWLAPQNISNAVSLLFFWRELRWLLSKMFTEAKNIFYYFRDCRRCTL